MLEQPHEALELPGNAHARSTGEESPGKPANQDPRFDIRESLANDRKQGPAHKISLAVAEVATLHGILIDLDQKCLRPGNSLFPPATDPEEFHRGIAPVLERHPLLRNAEVRASGTGLHLLLWLEPALELKTEGEQRWWRSACKLVQMSLPSDANAPGLTAMTRPVGEINSKTGCTVRQLKQGKAVTPEQVQEYLNGCQKAPFQTLVVPLLGSERVSPCPTCNKPNSSLAILEREGRCYHCGSVKLHQILDLILADPGESSKTEPPESNTGDAATSTQPVPRKRTRSGKQGR